MEKRKRQVHLLLFFEFTAISKKNSMSPYYIFEDVYISMGTSNFNAIDYLILIILMFFVIFF